MDSVYRSSLQTEPCITHELILNFQPRLNFLLFQAYWISVIWRCYKYLTLRQQTMRNTIHYILPEGSDRANEPDYPSLFRDHESAFGSAMKQTPPPSYQDIMEDQPPPYPASLQAEQETPYHWRLLSFYPGGNQSEVQSTSAAVVNEDVTSNGSTSRIEANVEVTAENQEEAARVELEDNNEVVADDSKVVEEEGATALPVEISNIANDAGKTPANLKF